MVDTWAWCTVRNIWRGPNVWLKMPGLALCADVDAQIEKAYPESISKTIFTQDIFEHHGSRAKPGAHYISCAQFRFPLNSMPSEMMSHLLCLAWTGRKHKWTVIFFLFCLFSGSIIIPWLPKQTCMVHQCFEDLVVPKYGICVAFEAELLVRHSSVLTTQLSP